MDQATERVAFPLTFLLKREGDQWASLACELDVASCGDTLESARQALKDAVETYVVYMINEGRMDEVYRPVAESDIADFLTEPPGEHKEEAHILLVEFRQAPAGRGVRVSDVLFVRSMMPATAASSYGAGR